MAELAFHVVKKKESGHVRHGLEFTTHWLVVNRSEAIEITSTWDSDSIIEEVKLSGFQPLTFKGGKWVPASKAAKEDWKKRRGVWRSITRGAPNDKLNARDKNIGGAGNLLIKYRVTMVLQDGTEIFVDPIIDERPT